MRRTKTVMALAMVSAIWAQTAPAASPNPKVLRVPQTPKGVLDSFRSELIALGTEHPELADVRKTEISGLAFIYRHKCTYLGKRGYKDHGPDAVAIKFRLMSNAEFKEQVQKVAMQYPLHRWKNLEMVGWIGPHYGNGHRRSGLRADVDTLLQKHISMMDSLDKKRARESKE